MRTRYLILSTLLLVVGVAGFVSAGAVAGVLETTPLLNALHCVAAIVAGSAAMRGVGAMRTAGQILGFSFAALATAAFVTDAGGIYNLVPLTTSNAWFHLALALTFLYHALLAPPTL